MEADVHDVYAAHFMLLLQKKKTDLNTVSHSYNELHGQPNGVLLVFEINNHKH